MANIELDSTAERAATGEASTTDDFGTPTVLEPADRTSTTIGSYRIEGLLGEGGMGRVYLARQENPSRKVALKVMAPGRLSEKVMRRFEYEAEILGRLQHPGIAQVYEAGAAKNQDGSIQPFFAMEYIEGSTLLKFMRDGSLDLRRKLQLLAEIADAVEHAHRRGVVHRDLKPGNIVVDREGRPKVLDFGVARFADANRDATEFGSLVGTLAYMSPEQASGDPAAVDTRSDVYSLGVVMYQAISGSLPIDLAGKTTLEAIRTIAEAKIVPLDQRDSSIPSDVALIAAKAVAPDKELRYSSAAAFAADIRRFLANEPIQARPPSAWYSIQKFVQRKRAQAAAMAVGVIAVVVASVIAVVAYGRVQAANAERSSQRVIAGRETWKGQLETARRLGQRGDWRHALQTLEAMDPEFAVDPVERELEVSRALVALNRRPEAKAQLQAINEAGEHEAETLLMRADFEMAEFGTGVDAGAMLRRAIELKTLKPADDAYAEGLLAEKTTAAIERFRTAIELDPNHRSARAALLFLLTLVGEHDAATRVGEMGRTLYPEDPNFVFSLAAVAALTGDRTKARGVLDSARTQFDRELLADLAAVIEMIADAEAALAKAAAGRIADEIPRLALQYARVSQRMQSRGSAATGTVIPALPCLKKSFEWMGRTMFRALNPIPMAPKDEAELAAEIESATADHPDGILVTFAAALQLPPTPRSSDAAFRRTDALCRQMERGVRMKSFVPNSLRSAKAATLSTLAELSLIDAEGKGPKDLDRVGMKRRLRDLAEYSVQSEAFDATIWNFAALAAAQGEDHRLSRRIAEEWAERAPNEPMAKIRVIAAEVKLGNSTGALRLLDEIEPKIKGGYLEEHAKRFRAKAEANIKEVAAKLK